MASVEKSRDLLSVILSFRNEEAVLDELIRRLSAALSQCDADHELIFINDDSTDGSLDLLHLHATTDPRIKIINMSRRFGVAECQMAGIERARGDAAIYMDCDLQDPPEIIPKLVAEWRRGADVVYTIRTRRVGESKTKLFITNMAYRVIDALSEIKLHIEAGDFRLISRRVVRELLRLREYDPYLRGLTTWVGFRQVPVYYERQARVAGVGHFPVLSANPVKSLMFGITSFSMLPLYVIFLLGMTVMTIAIIGLVVTGILALFGVSTATGVLISVGGLAWSTLMTAMGVVGIYVSRIYKDARGRPRYIVSDTTGFDVNH